MRYAIEPFELPTVEVAGEDVRFPVNRIFCIGKNYAAHAREMGSDPAAEPPSIFMKPATSVFDASDVHSATLPYPPLTEDVHHEVELVVALQTGGFDIAVEDALGHVFGYATGLDLTRRDMQTRAKEARQPWAMSKGFDGAAPIAALHRSELSGHRAVGRIWSAVDGEMRQDADLEEMIWPVPHIIAIISRHLTLRPGDLIFTGTPAGVGPVAAGQTVTAAIEGLTPIELTIG